MPLTRMLPLLMLATGCGSPSVKPDAPSGGDTVDGAPGDVPSGSNTVDGAPGDAPSHMPGMPGLGASGLRYLKLDNTTGAVTISSPPMTTQSAGSTIVVSVGRGDKTLLSIPTDNKGNSPYRQLGTNHSYSLFAYSGTAVYAFTSARGGAGFTTTVPAGVATSATPFGGRADEVTIAAIEVIEGTHIQDVSWTEDRNAPNTSGSVTTTAPATLIAFWWGDGTSNSPQRAIPGNGFTPVVDNTTETGSFVQCAVAFKNVSAPGTYNVIWTPSPAQGAQLWLVAVQ